MMHLVFIGRVNISGAVFELKESILMTDNQHYCHILPYPSFDNYLRLKNPISFVWSKQDLHSILIFINVSPPHTIPELSSQQEAQTHYIVFLTPSHIILLP